MKKVLKILLISFSLIGLAILLVAANKSIGKFYMEEPDIEMLAKGEVSLLTEEELLDELYRAGLFHEKTRKSELKTQEIEAYIKNMNEVESAEVYMELDNQWKIFVVTRRPIARVLLNDLKSFYIDDSSEPMWPSPYAKPRILTISGLEGIIGDNFKLSQLINNDSLKTKFMLNQSYRISNYVCNDAFYNAQIVQVHYTKEDGFILIPRIGGQKIIFGSAETDEEVNDKFQKLTTFYEEVVPYEGWNTYKIINLKFKDQIVAKKNN